MQETSSAVSDGLFLCGDVCFKREWSGFDGIAPINVVVGRNNTGKSRLLQFLERVCRADLASWNLNLKCRGRLTAEELKRQFESHVGQGILGGNHWEDHGKHFVNVEVEWETSPSGSLVSWRPLNGFDLSSRFGGASTAERRERLKRVLARKKHALVGKSIRRLLADRDIEPEVADQSLKLEANGAGASNVVRRFITSANEDLPREVVRGELLGALNSIVGADGCFSDIQVQEHDDESSGGPKDHWEIYLEEEKKGLVPLSGSGSGLKTLILVLLNLVVIPKVENRARGEYVFAFEELENNLHPAVLRRLFGYLEDYAARNGSPVFLTTHSSVAVDFFGTSEHAQIVHVSHDGESARTTTVSGHFDHLRILSELGVRPSDLLQANGVVWVEGPSDRIYLNRWIGLLSDGALREGRDYQCAFYGGALLARNQFRPAEEADTELANLFQINSNVVVVCDSDRSSSGEALKKRVQRIEREVRELPSGHIWITGAREIENYLPASVLTNALEKPGLPDPEQWKSFYPRQDGQTSYWEREVGQSRVDKVDLAAACVQHMTTEEMVKRFDWREGVSEIVRRIEKWSR